MTLFLSLFVGVQLLFGFVAMLWLVWHNSNLGARLARSGRSVHGAVNGPVERSPTVEEFRPTGFAVAVGR